MDSDNWAITEEGRKVSASQYLAAVEAMHAWTRRMASFWSGGFDLLVTPTIPLPPPLLGEQKPDPASPLAAWAKAGSALRVHGAVQRDGTAGDVVAAPLERRRAADRGAVRRRLRTRGRADPRRGAARGGGTLGGAPARRLRLTGRRQSVLRTRVCDLLGIEAPIAQAGMSTFTSRRAGRGRLERRRARDPRRALASGRRAPRRDPPHPYADRRVRSA